MEFLYLVFNESEPNKEYILRTGAGGEHLDFEERIRGEGLEKFLQSDNQPEIAFGFNEDTIGHFLSANHPDHLKRLYTKLDHAMLSKFVLGENIPNPDSKKDMLKLGKDIKKVLHNEQSSFGIILDSPEYIIQQFIRFCLDSPEHLTSENLNQVLKDPSTLNLGLKKNLGGKVWASKGNHEAIRTRFAEKTPAPLLAPIRGNKFQETAGKILDYSQPENAMTSAIYKCNQPIQEAIATLDYAIKQRLHIKRCGSCGKVFLASHGNNKYCTRPHPEDLTKTCREAEIADRSANRRKSELESEYRKAYIRLKKRMERENDPKLKAEKEARLKWFMEEASRYRQRIKKKEPWAEEEYKEYLAGISVLPRGGKRNG